MKHYLSTISERDKWTLLGGGLCLVLYLFYLFIYSPLDTKVTEQNTQLSDKINTLAWMKDQEVMSNTKAKKSVDNSQLLTLLSTQLKENQQLKFPFELQQTGSGEVQLTFDKVPFRLFLNWLESLDEHYILTIKQFDVDPTDTPGVTRLMIILSSA